MSWYYWQKEDIAESRARSQKKLARLAKEMGPLQPIQKLTHRTKIAASFWGRSWCQHLESLGDYSNRLPRGRTYVRDGSVRHLHIEAGCINALVVGSDLYEQTIRIQTLAPEKWQNILRRCQGRIGSLIELLQGKISAEILTIVTDREEGLFPLPGEIRFDCSCPDYASMCKHIAAVLYGVGARLDENPELLFTLRGVNHEALLATAAEGMADTVHSGTGSKSRRRLTGVDLGAVFGEEWQGVVSSPAEVVSAENPPSAAQIENPAPQDVPREPRDGYGAESSPPLPIKKSPRNKKALAKASKSSKVSKKTSGASSKRPMKRKPRPKNPA